MMGQLSSSLIGEVSKSSVVAKRNSSVIVSLIVLRLRQCPFFCRIHLHRGNLFTTLLLLHIACKNSRIRLSSRSHIHIEQETRRICGAAEHWSSNQVHCILDICSVFIM